MLLTDLALLAMVLGAPLLETRLARHPHPDAQALAIPWNGATPHLPHMPDTVYRDVGPAFSYSVVMASGTASWLVPDFDAALDSDAPQSSGWAFNGNLPHP